MSTAERLDILIVGAGLSGIGTAHHLKSAHPDRSFAILESRPQIGGTWDLFRYPGIRSDSDMHTLGYRFRPWTAAKSIAADERPSFIHPRPAPEASRSRRLEPCPRGSRR